MLTGYGPGDTALERGKHRALPVVGNRNRLGSRFRCAKLQPDHSGDWVERMSLDREKVPETSCGGERPHAERLLLTPEEACARDLVRGAETAPETSCGGERPHHAKLVLTPDEAWCQRPRAGGSDRTRESGGTRHDPHGARDLVRGGATALSELHQCAATLGRASDRVRAAETARCATRAGAGRSLVPETACG